MKKAIINSLLGILITNISYGISFNASVVPLYVMADNQTDTVAPSVPAGLMATGISQTSFDLSWAASTDNVSVRGYKVYKNEMLYDSTSELTMNISGLKKGVPYHFIVIAFDSAEPSNNSAASENFFVTTAGIPDPDNEAPTLPTGLSASEITENSFVLSWNASTDNVVVHGYQIYKNNTYWGSTVGLSVKITGLARGTTYAFQVDAIDAYPHNVSAKSLVLNVTTLNPADKEPPTVPSGLTATEITENSCTLSWTKSTDNVSMRGYHIYKDGEYYSWTTNRYINISGLICDSSYVFTVDAFDGAVISNVSAKCEPLNVSTTPCIDIQSPSVPTGLVAGSISETSVVLSWSASSDNAGVAGYCIYLNGNYYAGTSGLTMEITGLKKGATYNFTIESFDVTVPANVSAKSDHYYVTTSGTADNDTEAPSVPIGLSVSDLTFTSFTLSWAPSTDNVSVHGYQVYKDGIYLGGTVELSMNISGLTEGTTCNFTVDAFDWSDPANISGASEPLSVTTLSTPVIHKHLINWPQSALSGSPANLIDNWDYIETLPFDGIVIFTPEFRDAMTPGKTITYQQVYTDSKLGELSKKFISVRNNFLMVWSAPSPIDVFDDWDDIIANFAIYARAAHDAGCSGIIFDTEQYQGGIWQYPNDVSYAGTYTIEEYWMQMRMRGNQIMAAMLAEFPDIQLMVSHGPYWSEPQAFIDLPEVAAQIPANIGNLVGSFCSGMIEATVFARGLGHSPQFIDGGELYQLRSEKQFAKDYNWRKNIIASDNLNSLSIPATLRPDWANNVSISFGLYNKPFGAPMDASIMRNTIEYSLRQADNLVWFYSEGMDWYVPGGVEQDWIDAAKNGFAAGLLPVVYATAIQITGADGATSINVKDGTLQMLALFTPSNTNNQKVFWNVKNGTGEAKINQNGLLTAVADGTVTVKATTLDGSNVIGEIVVTLSNQILSSLPEAATAQNNNIEIYPNPLIHGNLTINFGKETNGIVSIYNVNGVQVLSKNVDHKEEIQIESVKLPKGILIVKAFIDGDMKVSKLIVE